LQFLDLYPTLVELCGLPAAEDVQGHSPGRTAAKAGGRVAARRVLDGAECRRTHRLLSAHRAVALRGMEKADADGAVLFDPARDPHEMTNLAADPQYAATIAEMKTLLAKAFVTMPSRIPRPTARAGGKEARRTTLIRWLKTRNCALRNLDEHSSG